MNKKYKNTIESLCGRDGRITKRIRTLFQAEAVIYEQWAEKNEERWMVAEQDGHRYATPGEEVLLEKAATRLAEDSP